MASAREARVENALQQLLERLVPTEADEDEATADQRWEEANELARTHIDAVPGPRVAEDVNHAADLIKHRLIRDSRGPEKATQFQNLYSRLLSQPVLAQKWGILYFLLKVAEDRTRKRPDGGHRATPRRDGVQQVVQDSRAAIERQQDDDQDEDESEEADSVYEETAAYNEAFAKNGLPKIQQVTDAEGVKKFSMADRPVPARPHNHTEAIQPQQTIQIDDRPAESALLRDLPFTLQGLSSKHLMFTESGGLKLPPSLPIPLISLLHSLAEPSLLYQSLASFVETSEGGLVGQSLRSTIGQELRSYLGLVASVEGQIRRALLQAETDNTAIGSTKAAVTLKRCVVWTRDATLGLRLMSQIVESTKAKKGGELISLIHSYSSSHGDPFVHSFAERLLAHISVPFYTMLRAWVYDGELEDPYLEFFVYENQDHEHSGATSVWEHKYRVNNAMIPSIVTEDFANKVFLIGKSLNFIRYGCSDGAWVERYSKSTSRVLQHGDAALLASSIDEAYRTVMARLIHLMENKFALFSHLHALKKYLLLGQGDFVALLMESLASNLDRPANSQYRHTLTAQLEHAIRNSNAQHDSPDVLRRLDARMLELSHGEIGWDVFTLEYRVDSPLDVIVTPWASKQYLKVFNFLWRVKRVEFALSTAWRRLQTGARGVLSAVSDQLGEDWKAARGGLAQMIHLVDQLQYYILFEVIEAGWAGLQTAISRPDATLDALISAHTVYLRSITRKGLLSGTGSSSDFTSQLHELLKLMLAYRDAIDSLYSYSVAEFTRQQEVAAKIETRTRAGKWAALEPDAISGSSMFLGKGKKTISAHDERDSFDSPIPPLLPLGGGTGGVEQERQMLDALRQRLRSLVKDFRSRVNVLIGDLAYQPNLDMRFLGVVMNFNDVYAPVRRKKHGKQAAQKEKEKEKEKHVVVEPTTKDGESKE